MIRVYRSIVRPPAGPDDSTRDRSAVLVEIDDDVVHAHPPGAPVKYDLVFEGGGAKGLVFAAAMEEFEAQGHTTGRLLGTSAGAIAATLLSVGYGPGELRVALEEKDGDRPIFASFLGTPDRFSREQLERSFLVEMMHQFDLPLVPESIEQRIDAMWIDALMTSSTFRSLFSLIELGGWYSAHKFTEWVASKLDSGVYRGAPRRFSNATLRQLHEATGIDLSMVASDTTNASLMILNHRTAPDCPVVAAVRMSVSIPFLWQEVVWHADWGLYRGRDVTGTTVVDGGALSNFPIELFISDQPYVMELMGPRDTEHVLGLLIDEDLPVPGLPPLPEAPVALEFGQRRTLARLARLIKTVVSARDKMVVDAFDDLVAHLPAGDIGTMEFDMSDARRAALCAAGHEAMREHLARRAGAAAAPTDHRSVAGRLASRILER
jgi:predicted acylesterase/phospholipase RssA